MLAQLLGDAHVKKVFHNFAFDVPILERHGFPIPPEAIEDTMVAHHAVCSELPHSLAFIATLYTDARAWKEAVKDGGKWKPPSDEVYALYCARDALTTWRIWENSMRTELTGQTRGARTPVNTISVYEHGKEVTCKVLIPLRKNGMLYDRVEGARISKVLVEREGFTRDRMQVLLAGTDYTGRMLDRRERAKSGETKDRYLAQSEKFHPGGLWAIRCALEALKIPIQDRTPTGLLATGQDILAKAAPYADAAGRDFVRLLIGSAEGKAGKIEAMGWRACVKLRTTYLDEPPVLLDGRIHADWRMLTHTGRFSTSPNMQNWAAFMRSCFVPPDGYVYIGSDFARVEWHVQALLSGDRALLRLFEEEDPHDVNARMIFGDRYVNADKDLKKRLRRLAKCVTGDTRVPTEAGLLPVATLRPDVTSGLGTQPCIAVVAGAPGSIVRATQIHALGEHPVVEVTTHCGYRIRCTPEHKFRTETGWVAAGEALGSKVQVNLSAGQPFPRRYVDVPVNPFTRKASAWQDQEPAKPAIVPITEAWGRLLGYYTGDGALVSGKAFHITTDGSRPEVVEDIGRTLLACGLRYSVTGRSVKTNAKVGRRSTGKRVDFQVHSAEGVRFMEGLGIKHLSTGALVPWPIWESPRSVVQAFLQAYFESDGSVSSVLDGRVTASSASQSFMREIQLLLAWLGVRTSLGTSFNALYNRDYYKVSTIGGGHRRFAAEVGFVSEFKRGRLAPAVVCDDEFYDQVESRVPAGTQPVFDLGVDDDSHCYTANGLVTHNSFVYGLGYGASDKTIWENLVTEWPDLQPREVSIVSKKMKKLYPIWFMWRDNLIDHVRTAGYLRSGITGRVRYFLSGMLSTEILNTAAQSTAADAANLAAVRLADRFEVEPRVKLVNQSHDSLTYEAPQDKAEWVKKVIEEVMPGDYTIGYNVPGYPIRMPVRFGVDVKIGKNWAEV